MSVGVTVCFKSETKNVVTISFRFMINNCTQGIKIRFLIHSTTVDNANMLLTTLNTETVYLETTIFSINVDKVIHKVPNKDHLQKF